MIEALSFLAQAPTTQQAAKPPSGGGLMDMLPLLIGMFAIMYFLMIRPQSKERKKREALLGALKKNDRVITIGGIVGTVTAVRDDEVTLKVDESSNTKITFSKAAIQRVLASNAQAATAETESPKEKK